MSDQHSTPTHSTVYRVGPSGWSYADWDGRFYPSTTPKDFDPLAYTARFFDAVEVNTSFYRTVAAKTSRRWVQRIARFKDFRFAFKLHQAFTHDPNPYSRKAVDDFLDSLAPMVEAGRLACVLIQFPWSFRRSPNSLDRLRRLSDDFGQHRLVVELRHDGWASAETEAELGALGLGICNIDQPALNHCLGPGSMAAGPVGYVRFHGRRTDTWFANGIEPFRRYDYLYTKEELAAWIPRIHRVGERAEEVYVFANNHYRGQAPANALQLRAMLDQAQVDVPPTMVEHFPELASINTASNDGFRETLF